MATLQLSLSGQSGTVYPDPLKNMAPSPPNMDRGTDDITESPFNGLSKCISAV